MNSYVIKFKEIDRTKLSMVGGKGANLGELSNLEDVLVPDGFCVTTKAFKRIIDEKPLITTLINELSNLTLNDIDKINELSTKIRNAIEEVSIPNNINEEITSLLSRFGDKDSYAVRSSAIEKDSPTFSFAGQQDTYLNIIEKESIHKHISKCFA